MHLGNGIAVALIIMSVTECTATDDNCRDGIQAPWVEGSESAVVFIGAVAGQLSMGYVGDVFGRNKGLAITLLIATFAAMLSSAAPAGNSNDVYITIIIFRFLLGVGIGGVYPLSAVKASEDAAIAAGENGNGSADNVNSVSSSWAFFGQMIALFVPWFLAYIISFSSIPVGSFWRLILGLGAVPSALATGGLIAEEYYSKNSEKAKPMGHLENAIQNDTSSNGGISKESEQGASEAVQGALHNRETYMQLLATGGTWFLFDIVVYGTTLFGGEIAKAISSGDDDVSSYEGIRKISKYQTIASIMALPASLLAIYLLPKLGLKWLQTASFLVMALFYFLMAVSFDSLKKGDPKGLFILYCFLSFAIQSGANITTFSLPAAVFKREIRSTCNGMAAATGKLGAIVGAYLFPAIAILPNGIVSVMVICCVVCLLGAVASHVLINIPDNAGVAAVKDDNATGTTNSSSPVASPGASPVDLPSHMAEL